MYKNIIFDYGNVLIDFDYGEMLKPYFENEKDINDMAKILFDRYYWDKLDSGEIIEKDVCKMIKDRVPKSKYNLCCETLNNWYYNTPPKYDMWKLVSELKKRGKKLFVLSNISITFAENYTKIEGFDELFKNFDGFIFSAKVGLVKPQSEIFNFLLNKFQINAKDSIFIDDNIKNINAAKNFGIDTFLFENNIEELIDVLKD